MYVLLSGSVKDFFVYLKYIVLLGGTNVLFCFCCSYDDCSED